MIAVWGSREIPLDEKKRLLEKQLDSDKSDLALRKKLSCEAALPDAASKAKLWELYNEAEPSMSLHNMGASMGHFNKLNQLDIVEPYLDKFFDVIDNYYSTHNNLYSQTFFWSLSPGFLNNEKVLNKFRDVLAKADKTKASFVNQVKDQIQKIEMVIEAKKMNNEYLKNN